MKWRGSRESSNVEDRRGQSGGMSGFPGGGIPMRMGGSIGSLVVMLILYFLFNNFAGNLGDNSSVAVDQNRPVEKQVDTNDDRGKFIKTVFAYTEDVWQTEFKKQGKVYQNPTLVLFTGAVESGCGYQSSQVGPFYCPADYKVYIDLTFFDELSSRFGASGDFAMAYVLAHEVGHHVQNLLGITDQMNKIRRQVDEKTYNRYNVALELQADYLAGVWAHHVKGYDVLEQGDLEEALNAANSIGDDTIQKRSRGYAVPDSFTHGTSEQRKYWLYRGFEYGDFKHGDTFTEILGR